MSATEWLRELDGRVARIQALLQDEGGRGMAMWHMALAREVSGLAYWWLCDDPVGLTAKGLTEAKDAKRLASPPPRPKGKKRKHVRQVD